MNSRQGSLDGIDPPELVRLTILGARFDGNIDDLELGDAVTVTVKAHVILTGRETVENDGTTRRVVKVRAGLIEINT